MTVQKGTGVKLPWGKNKRKFPEGRKEDGQRHIKT